MTDDSLSKDEGRFKSQLDRLTDEVNYIDSRISHYDELSFKIKGCVVELSPPLTEM
jgi:hypothetical protein